PGANADAIRLGYEGANALRVAADGDLLLEIDGGEIRQHRPKVYQKTLTGRKEIASRYELEGGDSVRIALADYDSSRPLVIDPTLSYSTYYGGGLNGGGLCRRCHSFLQLSYSGPHSGCQCGWERRIRHKADQRHRFPGLQYLHR